MLNAQRFREIVSGQRRGLAAALWRAALRAVETPYALAVRWRNRRYDRGRATSHAVEVPVICVGNLTLGGTGKTPTVEWVARWLRERGLRVTLVSRGYGAADGARNDEALELEQKLPDVPHLQNPDRVEAARMAIEEFEAEVILLDDGFQHRRLRRDLDLVLIDALEPFGFGHVFPRGTLREPLSGLSRAHVVMLSRADLCTGEEKTRIWEKLQRYAPQAARVEAAHRPLELLSYSGKTQPLESLKGKPVLAFCGIGNPEGFRRTLKNLNYTLTEFRAFADHHGYERDEVAALAAAAKNTGAAALVCTHKDLVKLGVDALGGIPLWAVRVGLEIIHGEDALTAALQRAIAR